MRVTMAMIALIVTFMLTSMADPLPVGLSEFFVQQTWSQEAAFNRRVVVSVSGSGGPVIIALHGAGGRGMTWPQFDRAQVHGGNYVLFAPDGYKRSWNVVNQRSNAPDVAFIEAIVDKAAASSNCDLSSGVTVMGFSNGCAFVHRLLIESSRPELARFACLAALLNTNNYHAQEGKFFAKNDNTGKFTERLPLASGRMLWSFHGTRDSRVPIEGGLRREVRLHSAKATAAAWGGYYGSTVNATEEQDGIFTKYSYLDDRVALYEMEGFGHGISRSMEAMMKVKQLVESNRLATTVATSTSAPFTTTTPSSPTSTYWAVKGCPGSLRSQIKPVQLEASQLAHVRCCLAESSARGAVCRSRGSRGFGRACSGKKTYHDAVAFCSLHGMRLCMRSEIESGMCCRKGCGYDATHVWTSTKVEDEL